MKAKVIDQAVLSVLSRCATEGTTLALPEQLDRKLYVDTNKVLEALGGKWNRKAKAHLFAADAGALIDAVLLTGTVELPDDFGFFPTPGWLVIELIERAGIRPGQWLLEPSAGDGAIVAKLIEAQARVDCIELLERNVETLRAKFQKATRIWQCDFLQVAAVDGGESIKRYDAIVMNPPFAKRADIHHVLHAAKFVKPGGRVVSVMSAGVMFREDRLTTEFREFVEAHGGSIEPLPAESFKSSGTSVNTVVVEFEG